MSNSEYFRRKGEALLREAADVSDIPARGRLIDEAVHWHNLALEADGFLPQRLPDNDDEREESRA